MKLTPHKPSKKALDSVKKRRASRAKIEGTAHFKVAKGAAPEPADDDDAPDYPELAVACPECDRDIDAPCIVGGDPDRLREQPHKARVEALEAAE